MATSHTMEEFDVVHEEVGRPAQSGATRLWERTLLQDSSARRAKPPGHGALKGASLICTFCQSRVLFVPFDAPRKHNFQQPTRPAVSLAHLIQRSSTLNWSHELYDVSSASLTECCNVPTAFPVDRLRSVSKLRYQPRHACRSRRPCYESSVACHRLWR